MITILPFFSSAESKYNKESVFFILNPNSAGRPRRCLVNTLGDLSNDHDSLSVEH